MKEVYKPKRSFAEKVVAQWPGFLGLGSIAAMLGYIWYAKNTPPHVIYMGPIEILVAIGVASLGYWAFAS